MVSVIRVTQKVRIYPEPEQQQLLAKAMGCCRWWWNRALKISNQTYKETGK
ncbi:MAG: helix-turn-helix domain-containing protein, partial [Cyanophyceae cyanobacterium]